MKEEWRPIKGFEGKYEVSNLGRIRSLNYRGIGKVQVLKLAANKDNYLLVDLCREGKKKTYQVHRLVAEAFIPNPNNLPCVNHLNEQKQDNRASNLEWCDHKYNNNYGSHNERAGKARCKAVICLELQRVFQSVTEVGEYLGCTGGNVSQAIKKGCKCMGYTLKFIEIEVL